MLCFSSFKNFFLKYLVSLNLPQLHFSSRIILNFYSFPIIFSQSLEAEEINLCAELTIFNGKSLYFIVENLFN